MPLHVRFKHLKLQGQIIQGSLVTWLMGYAYSACSIKNNFAIEFIFFKWPFFDLNRNVTVFLLSWSRHRTVHVVWNSSILGSTHQLLFLFQFLKFHKITSMPSSNLFSSGFVPFEILTFLFSRGDSYFVVITKVWIMLIVVIASVIFVLLFINWILKKRIRFSSQEVKITESSPIPNAETIYMYIVSTLLNQGINMFS